VAATQETGSSTLTPVRVAKASTSRSVPITENRITSARTQARRASPEAPIASTTSGSTVYGDTSTRRSTAAATAGSSRPVGTAGAGGRRSGSGAAVAVVVAEVVGEAGGSPVPSTAQADRRRAVIAAREAARPIPK
jgi:hypothetical protein